MSQSLADNLSIDRISKLWAAETGRAEILPEDIADDLVTAAELGEFEHTTHSRADAELGEYTYEETREDGSVEIKKTKHPRVGPYRSTLSMRGRQSVNAVAIQNYIKARQTAPGATDRETRQIVAREIFLSVESFRRWVDEPGFVEWARLRGLSRPCFIELASGDGAGQTSAVVEEPEGADDSSPNPPPARRRGRRPQYDWALFHAEIARKVGKDPDGFPVIQADLEQKMTDWCVATWGENKCPSESTIRGQVSKYYNDDSQGR